MTISEKILAFHAQKEEVEPGEFIEVRIDLALGNDITAPLAIKEFKRFSGRKVFDPERIVLVSDHFTPNKDVPSAENSRLLKEFAREQGLTHYYGEGEAGIEHVLLPEKGLVLPGELVIGADSHTCTYGALGAFATGVGSTDLLYAMLKGEIWLKVPESLKLIYYGRLPKWVEGKDLILYTIGEVGVDGALYKVMEFSGETISRLPLSHRFTMTNMTVEAGAKTGIIAPDEITEEYLKERAKRPYNLYYSDEEAKYSEIKEYDVSKIEPQIAFPNLPSNTKGLSQVGKITLDQVVIGSCTNGRIEDLRIAAKILKGERVAPYLRLIIIPATPWVYYQALKERLLDIFLEARAIISPPTCGPCIGGYMGILAKGERVLSTTNRNFTGRMGDPLAEIYLSNVAVAASSAILGYIGGPDEI